MNYGTELFWTLFPELCSKDVKKSGFGSIRIVSLHIDQGVWIQSRGLFSAQILRQCSDMTPWSRSRGHCHAQ